MIGGTVWYLMFWFAQWPFVGTFWNIHGKRRDGHTGFALEIAELWLMSVNYDNNMLATCYINHTISFNPSYIN